MSLWNGIGVTRCLVIVCTQHSCPYKVPSIVEHDSCRASSNPSKHLAIEINKKSCMRKKSSRGQQRLQKVKKIFHIFSPTSQDKSGQRRALIFGVFGVSKGKFIWDRCNMKGGRIVQIFHGVRALPMKDITHISYLFLRLTSEVFMKCKIKVKKRLFQLVQVWEDLKWHLVTEKKLIYY